MSFKIKDGRIFSDGAPIEFKTNPMTFSPHEWNSGEYVTVTGLKGIHKWANGKYKISEGEKKMDKKEVEELIERNCKLPLYFLLPCTASMNVNVQDLKYTTSKFMVADCLSELGLVFELKDGRLEPVTSITVP